MRIIALSTLKEFWDRYKDSEQGLLSWYAEVRSAEWNNSGDIKAKYRNASIIGNKRVVFNICGNKYRLLCAVAYDRKEVFVKFIGTHKQYNAIDAETYDGKYFTSYKKRK